MPRKTFLIHAKVKQRAAWYYLQVHPLRVPLLKKMIAEGGRGNLAQFGEVLASGWGNEPPETVKARFD